MSDTTKIKTPVSSTEAAADAALVAAEQRTELTTAGKIAVYGGLGIALIAVGFGAGYFYANNA